MKRLKRYGYISIQVVITAALILAVGFFGLMSFDTNGRRIMQTAMNKLDGLGIFGDVVVNPDASYDDNGYDKSLNINPADINPTTDFEFVWSDSLDGWVIVAYLNTEDKDVVIPQKNNDGKYIVKIGGLDEGPYGSGALAGQDLTSLAIPYGMKVIGSVSVAYNSLTSVIIPNSVISVEDTAFYGSSLSTLSLSSNIENIGSWAFYGGQFTSLVLPSTLTSLGSNAFGYGSMNAMEFKGDIQPVLGDGILSDNYGLVDNTILVPAASLVDYQANASKFGVEPTAFYTTGAVPSSEGVAYDGTWYDDSLNIVKGDINPDSDFVFEPMVNSSNKLIGYSVVGYNNMDDMDVVVPKYHNGKPVLKIGDYALAAFGLTSIALPNSIEELGYNSLSDNYISSIILPNSITVIGDYAMLNNGLTNLVMPSNVLSIGMAAFNMNQLPSSQAVFYSSTSDMSTLVSYGGADGYDIVIPNGVKTIGARAFWRSKLASLSLPNTVESMGFSAFESTTIPSLVVPNSVTSFGTRVFSASIMNTITLPNNLTTIVENMFSYSTIQSITIPSSVTDIQQSAFYHSGLTSVTIPASVTHLGNAAFGDARVLSSVTFAGAVPGFDYYYGGWSAIFYYDTRVSASPLVVGTIHVPSAQLSSYRANATYFGRPTTSFIGY